MSESIFADRLHILIYYKIISRVTFLSIRLSKSNLSDFVNGFFIYVASVIISVFYLLVDPTTDTCYHSYFGCHL